MVAADGALIETTYEPRLWSANAMATFSGRIYERLETQSGQSFKYHDDIVIKQDFVQLTDQKNEEIERRNIELLEMQYLEMPDDCHTRYCVGLTYMMRGEFELGLDVFTKLIAEVKDCDCARSAKVFSVECLRKLGRSKEAFDKGLAWAQSCQDYGELWFYIGRAALESDQRIKAHAAFVKAN